MENNNLENSKKKSSWGGKRENAGRDKGSMNKKTKEQKIVEEEFKERVLRSMHELINSQMSLAMGCHYLFKIHTEVDKKGNRVKGKPEIVKSKSEMESYLAGEYDDNDNDDYYFLTSDKPDNRALDSLIDRVFGKAQQSVDVTTLGKAINNYDDKQINAIAERVRNNGRDTSEKAPD